jgi:hypothetical protein
MSISDRSNSAPTLMTSQVECLPNHSRIRDADDARILIARRNLALDALQLDDETTHKVETELRAIGWPSDLQSNAPCAKHGDPGRDHWAENDTRALLCLDRHKARMKGDRVIWEHFFHSGKSKNAISTRRAWLRDSKRQKDWDHVNNSELVRLYENDGVSFYDMFSRWTFNTSGPTFTALELEIFYAKAKVTKTTSNTEEEAEGKGKAMRGEDDDD